MSTEPKRKLECNCQICKPEFYKGAYMHIVDEYDGEDSESNDGEDCGTPAIITWVAVGILVCVVIGFGVLLLLPTIA